MISATDIEGLFRNLLDQIQDQALRSKAVEVWVQAAKQGGWKTVEELKSIPFTLLTDCKGISLVEHTIAVTEGAIGLAQAQEESYKHMPYRVNMDRLICGGLLHDVGKLLEYERNAGYQFHKSPQGRYARHPVSGAILAAKCGLPDDVVNTIACHAKEGEGAAKVVETVLIHQADFATFDPLVMLKNGLLIQ